MAAVIGLTSTYYLSFEFHLFFQTRCLLLKYLILELTILREVLHCASERGSFILLELAAMMLSTPPQVQPLGEVQRHIYLYIMLPEIGAVYNHEYM